MIGHFPFPCGAGQMSSVVCEYHDCPSLEYLEELFPEIFDSPRVQVGSSTLYLNFVLFCFYFFLFFYSFFYVSSFFL